MSEDSVYQGVRMNHPAIVDAIRQAKKNGETKEHAQKVIGVPREVIDREWKRAENNVG